MDRATSPHFDSFYGRIAEVTHLETVPERIPVDCDSIEAGYVSVSGNLHQEREPGDLRQVVAKKAGQIVAKGLFFIADNELVSTIETDNGPALDFLVPTPHLTKQNHLRFAA